MDQQLTAQKEKVEKLLSRFKTPSVSHSLRESLKPLFEKLEKPEEFIPEAISDYNHDIEMLCLIEDGIEMVVRIGKL